jgi:Putative abortive phage resistance protein AbiGi, antitoxin
MNNLLYHSFARSQAGEFGPALYVLKGIMREGFFLAREELKVPWRDPCGGRHSLGEITQYRLCLTSLDSDAELRSHCEVFGPIAIGFKAEFIRNLGGFPVFYLPAPIGDSEEDGDDRLGVSLVYRLAELRSVLERIRSLPTGYQSQIYSEVQDVQELEGAVRFLGNILYFTDYTRQKDIQSLRYYRQREWRVIAGLTSDHVRVQKGSSYYVLSEYQGLPIHRFIDDVVVHGTRKDANLVDDVLRNLGVSIRSRIL